MRDKPFTLSLYIPIYIRKYMSDKIVGMFGGKFLPLHKGHLGIIQKMAVECDIAYLCLFINTPEERRIGYTWYLDADFRYYQLHRAVDIVRSDPTVRSKGTDFYIGAIDCSKYMTNWKEDWLKEAQHIRDMVGVPIDRVYSSEPSYDPIFKEAYPGAEHVIVDPERTFVPVSGTMLRESDDIETLIKWMV